MDVALFILAIPAIVATVVAMCDKEVRKLFYITAIYLLLLTWWLIAILDREKVEVARTKVVILNHIAYASVGSENINLSQIYNLNFKEGEEIILSKYGGWKYGFWFVPTGFYIEIVEKDN